MPEPRWLTVEEREHCLRNDAAYVTVARFREHALAADARIAALERIADMAQEVAQCGIESSTRNYLVVQIDHTTWQELRDALRAAGRGGA